jgi:hypothetical protein
MIPLRQKTFEEIMPTTIGIFERRPDAERAFTDLEAMGLSKEQITILTPRADESGLAGVPTTGPVLAIGLAGGALLGSLTGAAIGGALEEAIFPGIPEQELFVYEDALRQGRTAVVAVAKSKKQAEAARGVLEYVGAESIDRARQMWWLGIRGVEKEHYASGA